MFDQLCITMSHILSNIVYLDIIWPLSAHNLIAFGCQTFSHLDKAWGKVHLIWQGGDEDIEKGLWKFSDTRKGGSENIVGLGGGGGGGLRNL